MSTSEESFDHREPAAADDEACTPPLDKATVQCPRGQGTLEDEGERGWRSPSSPSLETQARHRAALKKRQRRILEEIQEIEGALFYLSWKENVPGHEIRPLGEELVRRLAARREMFYGEHRDLNLGIAFLHLMKVDMSAFLRLALDEPTKNDVRLLKREYWEIGAAGSRRCADTPRQSSGATAWFARLIQLPAPSPPRGGDAPDSGLLLRELYAQTTGFSWAWSSARGLTKLGRSLLTRGRLSRIRQSTRRGVQLMANKKPPKAILPKGKAKKRTPKRKLKAAPGLGPGSHHGSIYKGK